MIFERTGIPDVVRIRPKVFGDQRGFFLETWRDEVFRANVADVTFVQDNQSRSGKGTLRGLHYQLRHTQGKLVGVTAGAVFDVAVDMRRSSPTYGHWVGETLTADNHLRLWVPPGFAHGFLVLSDFADFVYKCTDYYDLPSERTLLWNDAQVGVEWPLDPEIPALLSQKDQAGLPFSSAESFP